MANEPNDPHHLEQLEGRYANYLQVGHNAFEFILEFGQLYSENVEPQKHTRIVTNPAYAKAFSGTLQESVAQYEQTFGTIRNEED